MIDTTTEAGAHAVKRLQNELIIWLTTVRSDGQPQTSPVWFLWYEESFLIYSRPEAQKLRNLAQHAQVSLHLEGDSRGGDIVTVEGRATIDTGAPPADRVPAYADKYRAAATAIGQPVESLAQAYSTAIRVIPHRVRAW